MMMNPSRTGDRATAPVQRPGTVEHITSTEPAGPPEPADPAENTARIRPPSREHRHQPAEAAGRVGVAGRALGVGVFGLACVVIALVAPLPYLTRPLSQLAQSGTGLAAHYAGQPAIVRGALILHGAAGGLALLLTPLQMSPRLRRTRPGVHRVVGPALLATILVSAVPGLLIAQVSYAGLVGTLGFSALALLWTLSAVQAVRTAVRGERARHRDWALRTVALTFAAVTLRAWLGLLVAAQLPDSHAATQAAFDRVFPLMPFLCWVPNLLVAQWLIRRRRNRTEPAGKPTETVTAGVGAP